MRVGREELFQATFAWMHTMMTVTFLGFSVISASAVLHHLHRLRNHTQPGE